MKGMIMDADKIVAEIERIIAQMDDVNAALRRLIDEESS